MRKLVILLVLVAVAAAGGWWYTHRALPADIAARVDGVDFPVASVNVFVRLTQQQKPDMSRRKILDGLIENHLFAVTPLPVKPEKQQGSGLVGYSDEARYENDLFRLVRRAWPQQIEASLKAIGAGKPDDLYVSKPNIDKDVLAPILTLKPGLYPTMTDDQQQAAKQLVLVRYRVADGSEHDLTLDDVYRRQNVQLKVQLHDLNLDFLHEAMGQLVSTQYVLNWFRHDSGLSASEVAAIERMVQERFDKEHVMHELGLMQDMHDDHPQMEALAKKVTSEQIHRYYDAHRDQFQRVEKVRARHIKLTSQEEADKVFAELRNGLDFGEAIKRYSHAEDKNAAVPGDLGWIQRNDRHTHWLRSLAFVQPLQKVSAPFRSPVGLDEQAEWEIVYLDEKVMGYQPVDSESVRYEASKSIAREELKQQYAKTREKLWREADVRYNKEWLNHAG